MTVETLRALNKAGLKEFKAFIDNTIVGEKAGGAKLPPPTHLLTDSSMTDTLAVSVTVDTGKTFANRFEMAQYINAQLDPVFDNAFYGQVGLWAWLALFYFEQLRREGGNTQRSEHFIPDEWQKQTAGQDLGYRHSVRTPVYLLRSFGPDFAKFFLTGRPTHEMGDIVEQVLSRPKIWRNERLRETITHLYQAKSGGFKRGAATAPAKSRTSEAGRGGIRRFMTVYVPRVKLGYDIDEMPVGDIVTVCGFEISNSSYAK
jgi:hypothetical protein